MTADLDLDRRLATWFADEAPERAPDRVLAVAMDRVDRTPQGSRGIDRGWRWRTMSRPQRLVLSLVSLLLLGGVIAVGAYLLTDQAGGWRSLVLVTGGSSAPGDGGLTVHLREPDGTTTTLASFTKDALGGTYAEGAAVGVSADGHLAVPVSMDGGSTEFRILDLRDPFAPPRVPDAQSMQGAWGPGDRFAMFVNAGGYAIYDVHTGQTDEVPGSATSFRQVAFLPIWAANGAGLQADRQVGADDAAQPGVLGTDGEWQVGATPAFETGIGPRRTAPDGSRLRCTDVEDGGCEEATELSWFDGLEPRVALTVDDPTVRLADFASSVDGTGLWVLEETRSAGPRTVRLLSVDPTGAEREVVTFDAVADDPDENSYFQGASIAAMAPDDAWILVRLAGDQGSTGSMVLVEPETGRTTTIDGLPAGLLAPDWGSTERPAVVPIVDVSPEIRGTWAMQLAARIGAIPEGWHGLTMRRASADLGAGFGQTVRFAVEDAGDGRLRFTQRAAALDCGAGSTATYAWAIDAGRLVLTPEDETCTGRALLLGSAFEATLPYPDSGSVIVAPATTVVIPDLATPLRLTTPSSGPASSQVHDADRAWLSNGDDGEFVAFQAVTAGTVDPCDHFASAAPIGPGVAGALERLRALADHGLVVSDEEAVVVGGQAGVAVTVDTSAVPADCGHGIAAFMAGAYPTSLQDGARIILLEPAPGLVLSVVVTPAADGSADRTWSDALIDSVEFLGP